MDLLEAGLPRDCADLLAAHAERNRRVRPAAAGLDLRRRHDEPREADEVLLGAWDMHGPRRRLAANCAAHDGLNRRAVGRRDPMNPWDHFNPTGDGVNRIDDILEGVQHYYIDYPDPDYSQD